MHNLPCVGMRVAWVCFMGYGNDEGRFSFCQIPLSFAEALYGHNNRDKPPTRLPSVGLAGYSRQ